MRLIDAYKAASHLMARLVETANNNVGYVCDASSIYEDVADRVPHWIDEVPKIDAAPVRRGKWIDDNCSECGQYVYHGDMRNYCPCCGAKME